LKSSYPGFIRLVSTIDTITPDGDHEIDIRGWIRTVADSGKPIYVGIYTSGRRVAPASALPDARSPRRNAYCRCNPLGRATTVLRIAAGLPARAVLALVRMINGGIRER
jgi:hypothetical protein